MAKLKLKHDAWIVIMDGEKALFLLNDGDELYYNLKVFREIEQENPPTREQGTSAPGRFPDGGPNSPGHMSAVQETDWHRLAKDRFASEIAERLYRHAHKHRFEQLVLVAPPQVLGAVRRELHKEVSDRVIHQIAKDLTSHPVDRIEKLIGEELGAAK